MTSRVAGNPIVKQGGLEVQLETLRIESSALALLTLDPAAADLLPRTIAWTGVFLICAGRSICSSSSYRRPQWRQYEPFWVKHGFLEMNSAKVMGYLSQNCSYLPAVTPGGEADKKLPDC